MAQTRRGNWRGKIIDHVTTIARAISHTEGGVVHTVQLLLDDPAARSQAIDEARARVSPTNDPQAYMDVQNAADALRSYEGTKI